MPPTAPKRLYFDNAATSFPKPACVHEAMVRYGTEIGGTAGRGNYHEAREGARIIRQCRQRLCSLIGGRSAEHIIFGLNGTDALNLGIKGVVANQRRRRPGARIHLVTTAMDHNSVLRPMNALVGDGIECTRVDADPQTGLVSAEAIRRSLRPETVLVAMVHASNVTGIVQPVAEIGQLCRSAEVPLLVDAAQSVGHLPIDVGAMHIDMLAFPGHKGLLGPLGTGILYIRPGLEGQVDPVREGGTGSQSEHDVQPVTLPDKYEPGSQNAIGIAGLSAGVAWIQDRGEAHWAHERDLVEAMLDGLVEIGAAGARAGNSGLRLIGPQKADDRVGVFSLVHDAISPHELAGVLEQEFGILARAGLHCAPHAHGTLGTTDGGGALRLSLGPFLSVEDVRFACRALGDISRELAPAGEKKGVNTPVEIRSGPANGA